MLKHRNIVEALDAGNAAYALKLIQNEKVQTATLRGLKAQALLRLLKIDEALSIAKTLVNEEDCKNLDAEEFQFVYKIFALRGQYELGAKFFQLGQKYHPSNENICVGTFYALAKAQKYAEQQLVAQQLYAKFQKMDYLVWNIISLVISSKYLSEDDEQKRNLQLMLAYRFMDVALKKKDEEFQSDKTKNYPELLHFYVDVLRKSNEHQKALNILKKDTQIDHLPNDRKQFIAECLLECANTTKENIEQSNAIYTFLLKSYNCDEWNWWTGYIESVLKLIAQKSGDQSPATTVKIDWLIHDKSCTDFSFSNSIEKAKAFMKDMQERDVQKRGPFLAEIEFQYRLLKENIEKDVIPLHLLLISYFSKFSSKLVCFSDIKKYVMEYGTLEFIKNLQLSVKIKNDAKRILSNVNLCRLKISLNKRLEQDGNDGIPVDSTKDLVESYFDSLQYGTGLQITENQYGDEFLHLYVDKLSYEAVKNSKEIDPSEIETALTILEYAHTKAPYNAKIIISMIRLYCLYGCPARALELFLSPELAIKHVQYDSLSYLIYYDLENYAIPSKFLTLISKIKGFINVEHMKETPEMIEQAYKNQTASKIIELDEFKRRVDRSLLAREAFLDDIYSKLCTNISLVSDTVSCLKGFKKCPSIPTCELSTNEDLSVCMNSILPETVKMGLEKRRKLLELKETTLDCLYCCSQILILNEEKQQRQEELKNLKKSVKKAKGGKKQVDQQQQQILAAEQTVQTKYFESLERARNQHKASFVKLQKVVQDLNMEQDWNATIAMLEVTDLAYQYTLQKYNQQQSKQADSTRTEASKKILQMNKEIQEHFDMIFNENKKLEDVPLEMHNHVKSLKHIGKNSSTHFVWWIAIGQVFASIFGSIPNQSKLLQSTQEILNHNIAILEQQLKNRIIRLRRVTLNEEILRNVRESHHEFGEKSSNTVRQIEKCAEHTISSIQSFLNDLLFQIKTMKTG